MFDNVLKIELDWHFKIKNLLRQYYQQAFKQVVSSSFWDTTWTGIHKNLNVKAQVVAFSKQKAIVVAFSQYCTLDSERHQTSVTCVCRGAVALAPVTH